MPRLSRDVVKTREDAARDIFKNNPNISVPKANKLIEQKFQSAIRASRMYALRAEVRKSLGLPSKPGTEETPTQAGRRGRKPIQVRSYEREKPARKRRRTRTEAPAELHRAPQTETLPIPFIAKVSGPTEAEGLRSGLNQLREAGLTNLSVDAVGTGYVVINTAA